MENKEIALQLAKAAIAGGAVKFITERKEEEINEANAKKNHKLLQVHLYTALSATV